MRLPSSRLLTAAAAIFALLALGLSPEARAAAAPTTITKTKGFPGFTVGVVRAIPKKLQGAKADKKAEEELAKLEAEAQAALDRTAKTAQAMFDHFKSGKHAMRQGLEALLDPAERPADDKKSPWIAVGLADADKTVAEALKALGLEPGWIRLNLTTRPNPELIARVSAAFLLCQIQAGGPLQAIPKAGPFEGGVPASLVASLDRVTIGSVVQAWRVRDLLAPIGLNKVEPKADGREGETKRAKVVARAWSHVLDGTPFPEVVYESAENLGPADIGGTLELLARATPEPRVLEVTGWIFKKFDQKEFAGVLDPLHDYVAKAFDFPTAETVIVAVHDGDAARLQRLLKAGAPANARDKDKIPAIVLAVELEKVEAAKVLGEGGADLGAMDKDGRGFFELAVWKRQTELVKALAPKADFKDKARAAGEKALLQAVKDEDVESVRALLAAGANPNVRDSDKAPVLVQAANAAKATELVEAIAGAPGVKLDEADRDKKTALIMAAELGKLDAVKTLLAKGAKTDPKSKRGKTAAELAEEAGHTAVAAAIRGK